MSEKEINDLIQTGNIAEQAVSAELMRAAESHAQKQLSDLEEQRKKRKRSLIKLGAMMIFTVLILIFTTIAWFTMNREAMAGSMAMDTAPMRYVIEPLSGGNNIFQSYHDEVKSDDALIWAMTSTANMDNYSETDKGIKPGSFGQISFYVRPSSSSINLDLSFEIKGYSCTETTDENTNETDIELEPVSSDLQAYLTGHILLFGGRTETTDPQTGKKTYTYSDPILSANSLARVMRNRSFTKANEDTPVNIYWVWPKTLSTLIDATENDIVDTEPFCSDSEDDDSDYKLVVANILAHPTYYFYNYTPPSGSSLSEDLMVEEYETYGEQYDGADNAIGMNVNYITLKMTTEESAGGA